MQVLLICEYVQKPHQAQLSEWTLPMQAYNNFYWSADDMHQVEC